MSQPPSQASQQIGFNRMGDQAILTEAARHVDIVHTSLMGMTAIVLMLLAALALPVFGRNPVTQPFAFWVMTAASFIGIGGLYYLNYRVHQHVTNQARLTEVLVNSLGQGFVVFGADGLCEKVYSQACYELLEGSPANRSIAEVLRLSESESADFKEWVGILFQKDHALGFDDVVCFFPKFFPHTQGRRVSLVYRPITGANGELKKVLVIATDQTEEFAARQAAKKQQNFAEMICRVFGDRNQFQSTLAHVRDFLEDAGRPGVSLKDSTELLRQLHTLKAAVKQFNLLEFGEVIHEVENELRAPDIGVSDDIFCARLEEGCRKIEGELVRVRDEVCRLIGGACEWRGAVREIPENDLYAFAKAMEESGVSAALMQSYLETIVAVPVRDCFRSFERELAELAGSQEKQVKPVRFEGDNPRILAQPMQEFLFSLTHICRNIVDHGIELPVTRMARGKDAAGLVTVSSSIVKNEKGESLLRLAISDDGNGIDPSRVRAKLASIDPDGAWREEDDQAIVQRIFSWGFTTTEKITHLSGRGVGTEVVEQEVHKLGGTIRVSSELYKGSTFEILLPYKLSIDDRVPFGETT